MKYEDFLPAHIAMLQRAFDLNYKVWRLRSLGWKYKEIAELLGVCNARAQQRYKNYKSARRSPAEVYLNERSDLAELSAMRNRTNSGPTLNLKSLSVIIGNQTRNL